MHKESVDTIKLFHKSGSFALPFYVAWYKVFAQLKEVDTILRRKILGLVDDIHILAGEHDGKKIAGK